MNRLSLRRAGFTLLEIMIVVLIIGLLIGVVRMVLDFSYRAPLCMEIDERPAFITKVKKGVITIRSQRELGF